jgi:D-arabinose 1-dehydrogenase-like Zn-dependent alcohol dehydrogenase
MLDCIRIGVHAEDFVTLLKQVDKVAPAATSGVEDLHPWRDSTSKELVEKIDIDVAKLLVKVSHEIQRYYVTFETLDHQRESAKIRESTMAKMRAVQIARPGGPLELVERDIPEPGPGTVRLKVQACGICHSDSLVKDGRMPGLQYPRVPGHEVAGVVDALGQGVQGWKAGQRAGVGWHGGNCGYCDMCRRGNFFACQTFTTITGITTDGGYADYLIARSEALAIVPDELPAEDAAPLMCAGVTTFNCLRHSDAGPGEVVAILGLGGLGHLGVQFAAKMGFKTVGIARGADKEALARQLGAWHYIDSQAQDPAAELQKLGGAKVILATVTNNDAMQAVLGGLSVNGTMMLIGAAGPFPVSPVQLLSKRQSVEGWYSGTSIDSQDTLAFSVLTGARSMNETFPLERAREAYERMESGKARFRVVLTTGN